MTRDVITKCASFFSPFRVHVVKGKKRVDGRKKRLVAKNAAVVTLKIEQFSF
jgi:hypothetical protein